MKFEEQIGKYKEKTEMHLKENNIKIVWYGVNLMSGYKSKHSQSFAIKIERNYS